MTKAEAGRLGGKATVKKHGAGHMANIGYRGAVSTWSKYRLQPNGASGWLMVSKETGEVKAKIGYGWLPFLAGAEMQLTENEIPF